MKTESQIPALKALSYELRLFGVHSGLERRNNESLATSLHPLEYLRLVLEDEKLFRQEKTAKTLTTRAKFRSQAELENWDQSYERGLTRPRLKDLSSLGFLANQENLLLIGSTGTGKTHLAIALEKKLCFTGVSVQFGSTNLLLEEALAERTAGKYLNWIKRITRARVLIIDDFALRQYTHEEAGIFLDLFEERYRKGILIITSQVDPKGWKNLFEDPVIAESVTDRMINPGKLIELKGQSYRERLKNNS